MTTPPTPSGEKSCELITDHTVVWAGDGYYCSKCMQEFIKKTTLTSRLTEIEGKIAEEIVQDDGILGVRMDEKYTNEGLERALQIIKEAREK